MNDAFINVHVCR